MLSQSVSSLPSRAFLACASLVAATSALAQTRPLNDTGQTLCYDAANAPVPCSAAVGGDNGVNPRQDGRYGRDAAAAAGRLTKISAGDAGFDFTKIANNGSALPTSAALGSGPTDWACTRDNVTGLMWEVKTTSGLRSQSHTYTWYSTDSATNGGFTGILGADTCGGSLNLTPYNNQCNSHFFVAAVNAVSLCGRSDWRLPSRKELLSLVHAGNANPSIDTEYFPNTSGGGYWTITTIAGGITLAWIVHFDYGYSSTAGLKSGGVHRTRLVRGEL